MIRARHAFLLAAIVAAALVPRLYHVRSPFMTFADHNTSNFSIFARTYLDQGLVATRLGQVRGPASGEPASALVFAHHPPTIALLTAAAFRLLGVSEWAARALPLVLSSLTGAVVFLLGRDLRLRGGAAAWAGLFALAPGAIYYGQMLDHEAFVSFLGLLALLAWRRHAETGRPGWWRSALALVAATALTDWPGAYLAPAIAAGSWLDPRTRRRAARMTIQAFLVAGISLAAVGLHVLLLKGSLVDLLASLRLRALSSAELSFTWGEYLHRLRLNLEYALTPVIFWAAIAGMAVIAARTAAAWRRDRAVPPRAPLLAALAIFCGAHHVVFTNACHYNEHLIYYLLPLASLGAVMLPASLGEIASAVSPRAGAAVSLLAAAAPIALFVSQAPAQTRAYFNDLSVPGWPLLGQALNDVIPEGSVLLTNGELAGPQLLHYLRRERYNDVVAADLSEEGQPGAFFLEDRNVDPGEALRARLAPFPPANVLNFELRDLTPGAKEPDIGPLRPPEPEWTPAAIRFGDALELTMTALAPPARSPARVSALQAFLGVPWSPRAAAGRVVHASFVWTRLDARAAALAPDYALIERAGGARAPIMWPLAGPGSDLAALPSGASARHEVDWFLGEWLPAGTYDLTVGVRDGPKSVRATGALVLGSVTIDG